MPKAVAFIFFFFIFCATTNAQTPKAIGIIVGNVIDKETQKPIANCTIKVWLVNDSLQKITKTTDKNGAFEFENLKLGLYRLQCKSIGFNSLTIDSINLRAERFDFNLGDIKLTKGIDELGEVLVYAEKPLIENKDGKITYNVGESALSSGNTTSELLKNMPLVSNDPTGKILLKGKEPKILIDDKPTELNAEQLKDLLESLPGSSIEKIELMTNPPPQYATEQGGVINIVTKKGKIGSTGKININGGTRGELASNINFTYRNKGFNLSTVAGYNYSQLIGNSYSRRENKFADSSNYFYTDGNFVNKNQRPNFRVQIDNELNKTNSIGLTYQGNANYFDNFNYNSFTNLNQFKQAYKASNRTNQSEGNGYNHNLTLNYTKKGKNALEVLRFIVTGIMGKNDNDRDFYQQYLNGNLLPTGLDSTQNQLYDNFNKQLAIRVNYDKPLKWKSLLLSTGATYTAQQNHNQLNTNFLSKSTNQFVLNDLLSNNFKFYQNVFTYRISANLSLTKKTKLTLGIQAEHTNMRFHFIKGNASNVQNNYVNILPNINLRQEINKEFNTSLIYRAAIRRPSIGELNPNVDYSDPYNIRFGNPYLAPSLSHNFDWNVNYYKGKFYINTSIGFNLIKDVINSIRSLTPEYKTQVSFVNIADRKEYEAGVWGGYTFSKKIRVNSSLSFTHNQYSEEEKIRYRYVDGNTLSSALNFNYTPNTLFTIETNFRYSQFADPQGRSRSNLATNFGFMHKFVQKRLQVSINIIDPFSTQQFTTITTGSNFYIESFNNANTRNYKLAISWQLNKVVQPKPLKNKVISKPNNKV